MAAEHIRPTAAHCDAPRAARLAVVGEHEMRFRAATLCNGSGPPESGWPRSGRMARLAAAAEHGMRFPCKDPMELSGGRCGRVWHGGVGGGGPRRRSDKSRSIPIRLSGGRCGRVGHDRVGGGGPRRHFDKSRNYPMRPFGARCGSAPGEGAALGAVRTTRAAAHATARGQRFAFWASDQQFSFWSDGTAFQRHGRTGPTW